MKRLDLDSPYLLSVSLLFCPPAACARKKQHGLGVKNRYFPATSKPAARRLPFRLDDLLRHGHHCLRRGCYKAGEDIFQCHRAFRIGPRPVLDEKDGGPGGLRAKRCVGMGMGRLRMGPEVKYR
jgi:hypothetical protein